MTKRQVAFLTFGGFLSYFLFGFIDNMKGATISYILEDAGFNYSLGGTIIFGEYAGFFIATFISGVLSDWLGKKIVLIMSGFCVMAGVIGYAAAMNLMTFLAFIFLIGLGCGSLELSGGNIISSIHTKKRGRYLNLMNAFYGIGSVITPLLAGCLLGGGVSWRDVYRCTLFVVIPITLYFILMKYPKEERRKKEAKGDGLKELKQIVSKKQVLLMYVVIFAYVAAEIGAATWLADFWQNAKGIPAVTSSMYLSIHFAGMTVGRLLGSLFVDRAGHLRSLLLFTAVAISCMAVGIFGPSSMAFALAFTGFGFSIIFPTSTTVITEISPECSGTMLGAFYACGGLGGMLGPWLVGRVSDVAGLKAGMSVNILFCTVIVVSLSVLIKEERLC